MTTKRKRPPRSNSGNTGILVGLRAVDAEQKRRWEAAARADSRTFANWARVVLDREAGRK